MSVEAHGYISVYEQGGQYQLYVDGLRAAGEGLLYQEFLRLKAELEAEGLFDEARKRPIPRYPRRIGIVTSPTGAALQDMLNTLRGRYPLAEVVIAPATVQGDDAPPQIVRAIEALNRAAKPDVILVARGGGSLEDLWAFNDERVVRAVAASQAPVISGVGHETDFTLTDFAADLRAPTPTGAAVLAVPNVGDLAAELNGWALRLQQGTLETLNRSAMALNEKAHRLERQSPLWQVRQDRQYLDSLGQRLQLHMRHDLRNRRAALNHFGERLTGLDPAHILRRGYALIKDSAGSLITSAKQVKLGQEIAVQLADGSLDAQVRQVSAEEE
jgi:exodeoxyribonuclease VII large subunit